MTDYNPDGEGTTSPFTKLVGQNPKSVDEAAEELILAGVSVVANKRKSKQPVMKGWTKRRLRLDEVPHVFAEGGNLGLANGEPSGWLITIDIDAPEVLKVADRFLPATLAAGRSDTPRAHRFYVSPGSKTRMWTDDGTVLLELRSSGCQTLIEPSVHPSGQPYLWDRDGTAEPAEIAAEDLERHCTELAAAVAIARRVPENGRHDWAMALAGYLLRPGRLDEESTLDILLSAWHAAGADTAEAVRDLEGIVRDTAQKIAAGEAVVGGPTLEKVAPGLPALLARWWVWDDRRPRTGGAAGDGEEMPTHDELRDRFSAENPGRAYGLGEWRNYEHGVWRELSKDIVKREIVAILEAAKEEGIRPTSALLSSVLELSRVELAVPDDEWDANPDILVCQNGTLEISSSTLREHHPEDYALGAVPYEFDPEAHAPTWYEFLMSTVPDAASFLGEFAGYCLTVDTALETAVWLYGPPGSGKSTLIEGYKAMLGDRAGILGLAEMQRSRFALARIPGRTLLTATEQPSDYLSVTHLLNAIISGEEVRIEEKYRPAYTVTPRAKILWAMNDFPRVKDSNDGLFRRVQVVSFPKLTVEADPAVKEAIKGEGAGILVWALEGLIRLRERGHFEIPESVRAATEEFRLTNDVPRMFVEEVCNRGEGLEMRAQELYDGYRHFCVIKGHKPQSATSVASDWKRLGFGSRKVHGRKVYTGVEVDPEWIGAQDDYPMTR